LMTRSHLYTCTNTSSPQHHTVKGLPILELQPT
jgi:hypothetical protein